MRVGFVGANGQASSLLFLFLSYSFISSNTMFQTTFVALVFIEINVQSIEIEVPWPFAGAGREQCPSRRWGERPRRWCVLAIESNFVSDFISIHSNEHWCFILVVYAVKDSDTHLGGLFPTDTILIFTWFKCLTSRP